MIDIIIPDEYHNHISPRLLEITVSAVLSHLHLPETSDITVLIGDDITIQQLNFQYLGIDAPTDVLSFPSNETDPDTGNQHLGDIIISFPRALEQAQQSAHPVESELQLLLVHGTLHLLGFDHSVSEEKERMWSIQAAILNQLGVVIKRISDE
jgi:probable rRNA maturation factor